MTVLGKYTKYATTNLLSLAFCAGPQQQEEDAQAEAAAETDTSRPFTSDYLEEGRMADAFEPDEFKGMLFHDGVDSQGRPVIVVNTDAVGTARKARSQALQYMLHRLEPIVTQVCLVVAAWVKEVNASHLPSVNTAYSECKANLLTKVNMFLVCSSFRRCA